MKLKNIILPHLIAIGVFVALSLAYFAPMLQGKTLKQNDILQWKGSYEEIRKYKEETGKQTLWTNSMFSGMPAYQIGMEYHGNKSGWLTELLRLEIPSPAGTLLLLLMGFYILMLTFELDVWLAGVGAIAFAFSSYNFLNFQSGHETKILATAFAPLVLAGINLGFRGKFLSSAVITAIGLGLELSSNHLQITYYLMLIIVAWGIAEFIAAIRRKEFAKFMKGIMFMAAGAVVAIGLNLTNLMLTEEYSKDTIRGKSELTNKEVTKVQTGGLDIDYATQWSNGNLEPLTILIPNLFGGASNGELGKNSATYKYMSSVGVPDVSKAAKQLPLYFGEQPITAGPIYFGAIICFLFVFAMFVVKREMKWALFIITILSIFLSMGKNFMGLTELFFNNFPLYNKFRSVTMIMTIAQIALPILAFLGLKQIFEKQIDKKVIIKKLKISLYIVGGICAIFLLLPGMFLDFTSTALKDMDEQYIKNGLKELPQKLMEDREWLVRADAFRSLLFIGLSFTAVWMYFSGRLKKEYAIGAIAFLILFDLWQVDKRYMSNDEFTKKNKETTNDFPKSAADEQILADKEPDFRVLNLSVNPFADAHTSYYHKSIGGYHGAKFRRYQELKDMIMNDEWSRFSKMQPDSALAGCNTLNMLNCKYIIFPGQQGGQPMAYPNNSRLGNAWFVNEIKWVKNADSEIEAMKNFSPKTTAIVDEKFKNNLADAKGNSDENATIKLTKYEPNQIEYQSNSSSGGLAVFSEIYYEKGWKATIDGQPSAISRADYILRSMKIPAGSHKIIFTFDPETFNTGENIAMASSAILYGGLLVWLFFGYKNFKNKSEVKPVTKK